MITAKDVERAAFGRAKPGTSGYDEASVDDFLDRAAETIAAMEQGKPLPAGALTSTDVVEAVFGEKDAQTDGGYDLDDVDDLLDRVAQRLFDYEKKRGGARRVAEQAGAGTDDAQLRGEREDFRDEPASPELQDSPRSWDEEQSGSEPRVGVEDVEQYPATDRRVPLPSADVRSKLSDEDVRAQQNYHPDYSEYDPAAAAARQDPTSTQAEAAERQEHDAEPEQRVERKPVEPVRVETVSSQRVEPTSPSLGQLHDEATKTQPEPAVAAEPVSTDTTANETRPEASEPVPAERGSLRPVGGASESAPATQDAAVPSEPTQNAQTSGSVGRPESIERPEPIDRPREVPQREDKSRKGFFRRLFKG